MYLSYSDVVVHWPACMDLKASWLCLAPESGAPITHSWRLHVMGCQGLHVSPASTDVPGGKAITPLSVVISRWRHKKESVCVCVSSCVFYNVSKGGLGLQSTGPLPEVHLRYSHSEQATTPAKYWGHRPEPTLLHNNPATTRTAAPILHTSLTYSNSISNPSEPKTDCKRTFF